MANSIKTETLDDVTYYTTETTRGNYTTVWNSFGTVFVQVNRSAPRALCDIAKPSKAVKSILAFMEVA